MPSRVPGPGVSPRANARSRRIIKHDPDAASDILSRDNQGTTNSISDEVESRISIRNGRSDAPTPSERFTEGPLFREIRSRPETIDESPGVEDSFFDTSFSDIGKKLKACNDTLGELQQLGVSHDVQLPELVLVGDQSAGKSSLMSGLANLDLPRSEGTCTRCPLHIRVSRNTDWSCRVWLRKIYKYQPPQHQIMESDVTDADPFFPWRKRPVVDVLEFKTMHDKSEIEEVLRWAQIAILSDDRSHELFVPGSGSIAMNHPIATAAEATTAKFSPNVVALEIKGPDLPDLSFYDMPGIFQNPADAKDDYLVNVVRNLSKEYIQHPSAIIICAMPMNSDAENSSTFSLTRRLNATERTIGVLTKADLLPAGNHGQWLEILKGNQHKTGLGYFVTSRPQGKGLDDLKTWEERFFVDFSSSDWPTGFHDFQRKCGVENLKSSLSERLGEAFAKSLPTIKHKVKCHLDKIHQELASLPELPDNVELEVQTGLLNFADKARSSLDTFSRSFSLLPTHFRDCLVGMKPRFGLKDKSDAPVIEISDDESVVSAPASVSRRRPSANPRTPNKRQRTTGPHESASPQPTNGYVKREDEAATAQPRLPQVVPKRMPFPEPFTRFSRGGSGFRTLRQVQEEIQSKSQAGMPNVTPSEAYNDLAMEAIKPWKLPTEVFLQQTMNLLAHELESTLNVSLENLKKRFIYREMRAHLKSFLAEHHKATHDALQLLYNRETEKLYTLNKEALDRYMLDEKEELERYRHFLRMEAREGHYMQYQPWEDLTQEKRMNEAKRREAEMLKLGEDKFQREIQVAAYTRAYYRLAALRFADNSTQVIICDMIPAIRRQLPHYMDGKLGLRDQRPGLDARAVYERLMAEDSATASKRETLKSESKKFEKALSSIRDLESGRTDEPEPTEEQMEDIHMDDSGQDDGEL
ncbi:dynamin family protein [Paramyrothecium foliicola]|nr:dynamin family protein [Paramyrothecium foliicola]